MRIIATISFCLSLLFTGAAQAQTKCKDGSATTASGTVASMQQIRPEPGVTIWEIKPQGKITSDCRIDVLWGNGQAPSGCTAGKKFTATGKALDADSFWMLQSDKVTCN